MRFVVVLFFAVFYVTEVKAQLDLPVIEDSITWATNVTLYRNSCVEVVNRQFRKDYFSIIKGNREAAERGRGPYISLIIREPFDMSYPPLMCYKTTLFNEQDNQYFNQAMAELLEAINRKNDFFRKFNLHLRSEDYKDDNKVQFRVLLDSCEANLVTCYLKYQQIESRFAPYIAQTEVVSLSKHPLWPYIKAVKQLNQCAKVIATTVEKTSVIDDKTQQLYDSLDVYLQHAQSLSGQETLKTYGKMDSFARYLMEIEDFMATFRSLKRKSSINGDDMVYYYNVTISFYNAFVYI